MTVLAIDTASSAFALAVQGEGGRAVVVTGSDWPGRPGGLLQAIDQILAGRPPLSALVVVTGPGSYAGIRTGIATAEALALAHAIPAVGVGTLEALAEAAGPGEHVLLHPAGRGEWWQQGASDSALRGVPSLVDPAGLAGSAVVGEGTARFGGRELGPGDRVAGALRAGLRRLAAGEAGPLRPDYGRAPHITRSTRLVPRGGVKEEHSNVT
jgi:tRNA threonylcarbamoyl adenosine modification protein YeaZ